VNVLDEAAMGDLEGALAALEATKPTGVVVRSGKPGSFIAGADIHTIADLTDRDRVRAIVRRGQAAFSRLAALPCPTVAAIDGICLGGGSELALACDSRRRRRGAAHPDRLPGGAARHPARLRRHHAPAAPDRAERRARPDPHRPLGGRAARGEDGTDRARVPAAWLIEHAQRRLGEIAKRPAGRAPGRWRPRSLGAGSRTARAGPRAGAVQGARDDRAPAPAATIPAPLAVLSVLEHGLGRSIPESLALEESGRATWWSGAVCKNLIRIFLLSEKAKKDPVASIRCCRPAPGDDAGARGRRRHGRRDRRAGEPRRARPCGCATCSPRP
jgi:3-hydroxyacyl-CoA dehydrogenase/enoyl-CoA hydratase/3-hydroxybutyryl-CoA epimerase